MRKALVALMIVTILALALPLAGCGGKAPNPVTDVTNFFCKPTAAQTQAAQVGENLAQVALTALATLSGNLEAAALSQVALPVFQSVVAGACATQENWDAAVNAVTQANLQPTVQAASAKALAPATLPAQIAYLQGIKWAK
jgi:hypothetical protein